MTNTIRALLLLTCLCVPGLGIAQTTPTPTVSPAATTNPFLSISGTVLLNDGTPLEGVLVVSNFNRTEITDSNGNFSFDQLAPGLNYSLSIRKFGYSFTPETISATLTQNSVINVKASIYLLSIQGTVLKNGLAVSEVIIDAGKFGQAISNASGNYQLLNIPFGSKVKLSPLPKAGLGFSPKSSSFTLRSNREIDFRAVDVVATVNACSDGKDNDGDGSIDFPADIGCRSANDTTETSPSGPQCDDGKDNDADGLIDKKDSDCSASSDITEGIERSDLTCSVSDFAANISGFDDSFQKLVASNLKSLNSITKRLIRASRPDAKNIKQSANAFKAKLDSIKAASAANISALPSQILTCPSKRGCGTVSFSTKVAGLRTSTKEFRASSLTILGNYRRIASKVSRAKLLREIQKSRLDSQNNTELLLKSLNGFPKKTSVCG